MKETIKIMENEEDIIESYKVMKQLINIDNVNKYLDIVKRKKEYGYNMANLKLGDEVISVIGFRFNEYFGSGKYLFIDDFVTDENFRSSGYGSKLFDWIIKYAKENDCLEIQLDSNINKTKAHEFYNKKGMKIIDYHFSMKI